MNNFGNVREDIAQPNSGQYFSVNVVNYEKSHVKATVLMTSLQVHTARIHVTKVPMTTQLTLQERIDTS